MTKPEIRTNDETRMTKSEKDSSQPVSSFGFRHSPLIRISGFVLLVSVVGCTDSSSATTKPTSLRERQDAALKDPYGYKPEVENRDVSGGGLFDFNKDAMKKDMDHVFNP